MPGRYTVRVELDLAGTRVAARPFNVDVRARDPDRLAACCDALSRQALSATDTGQASIAADALAHVADPVAIPYLERLLDGSRGLQLQAIQGLGRIDDEAARQRLNMLSGHRDGEIALFARRALRGPPAGEIMD
jgi:hypothetical protein